MAPRGRVARTSDGPSVSTTHPDRYKWIALSNTTLGMLLATLVCVFLIPGLFAMVERIGFKKKKTVPAPEGPSPAPAGGH